MTADSTANAIEAYADVSGVLQATACLMLSPALQGYQR